MDLTFHMWIWTEFICFGKEFKVHPDHLSLLARCDLFAVCECGWFHKPETEQTDLLESGTQVAFHRGSTSV